MRKYDHRVHAGNAGDVWKHFLLLEAADCLFDRYGCLVYMESHAGRPEYDFAGQGEWQEGIGRCWPFLFALRKFCYFDILARINPLRLKCYPGSARLVMEAAKRRGSKLRAELWDIDEDVIASWCGQEVAAVTHGDGFAGTESLLEQLPPGLLLIDPPGLESSEVFSAKRLQERAAKSGWTVLWWYMMDNRVLSIDRAEKYICRFSVSGLNYNLESGCVVSLAGADASLKAHLRQSCVELEKIIGPAKSF